MELIENPGPAPVATEAHIDGSGNSSRSGRKRPLWAVPAEEIQTRRDEWLPHLAGKTTAEIQRWAGFEDYPVSIAEVWLWAVVHPALDLTCGPDGRWGLETGPQEVPAQLRSLVERWRAGRSGIVRTGHHQQREGRVDLLAALIREVDGDHSLGAEALAEALAARGVRVVPLPVVETDEWGDRIINIPRGKDSSMTGRVRLGQGMDGNKIDITGLPSSLEIEYAPAFAAAFLAASDTMSETSA